MASLQGWSQQRLQQEQLKTLLALNSIIKQALSYEQLCIQHAGRTQLHRETRQSSVCSPACSQPASPGCLPLRKNGSICRVTSSAQNTSTRACAGGGVTILISAGKQKAPD